MVIEFSLLCFGRIFCTHENENNETICVHISCAGCCKSNLSSTFDLDITFSFFGKDDRPINSCCIHSAYNSFGSRFVQQIENQKFQTDWLHATRIFNSFHSHFFHQVEIARRVFNRIFSSVKKN